MDEETIKQLYKTYLGRDLSPEQLKDVQTNPQYAGYQTPEAMTKLLSGTATSIKDKALSNAKAQRDKLTNAGDPFYGVPTGPSAPMPWDQYQSSYPGMQEAMQGYKEAGSQFDVMSQKELGTESRVRGKLKTGKGAHYFGETYSDMQKKYSDPNSPWYVPDPQQRLSQLKNAQDTKMETMNDIVIKIKDIYSVLTQAASNEMAAKSDQVEMLRKNAEKTYDTILTLYGTEMADQRQRESEERSLEQQKELIRYDREINPPSGGTGDVGTDEWELNAQGWADAAISSGTSPADMVAYSGMPDEYIGRVTELMNLAKQQDVAGATDTTGGGAGFNMPSIGSPMNLPTPLHTTPKTSQGFSTSPWAK